MCGGFGCFVLPLGQLVLSAILPGLNPPLALSASDLMQALGGVACTTRIPRSPGGAGAGAGAGAGREGPGETIHRFTAMDADGGTSTATSLSTNVVLCCHPFCSRTACPPEPRPAQPGGSCCSSLERFDINPP